MLVILLGAVLLAPQSLRAQSLPLDSLTCTGGASSAGAAFAIAPDELDCGPERFEWRTRFVRARSEVGGSFLPPSELLMWQTVPTAFDSMLLRFSYADGSQSLIDVDPQMAARNWFAGGRFSVPIPGARASLVSIDMVVERPHTTATVHKARLMGAPAGAREHFTRAVIYALICGLLLNPILYDLLFYRTLRARFMLWHMAMTGAILAFALSNTGLIFALLPDLPLLARWHLNTLSLAVVVASSVLFTRKLVEEHVVPKWLDRMLIASVLVMVAIKGVALIEIEAFRILIFHLLLLSVIPIVLSIAALIVIAFQRGSRTAPYIAVAFSGLFVITILRAMMSLWPTNVGPWIDDVLLGALLLLALGTSAGVGDRFMVLRLERNRARLQAARMGHMAHTDALTGLANRRAFDQLQRLETGQALIVADIDHFKRINDTLGHQTGDAVLCFAAGIMRRSMGEWPEALLFRLGGEEFAVVLPCADRSTLEAFCEHIRKCVEENEGDDEVDLTGLTVSIGAALGHGQALHDAFSEADGAMYRAKDLGRNRSIVATGTQPNQEHTPG